MKKIDKNQAKLGIKTYDYNVPKDHISRFVVEFIEEVYPILDIKENKKKRWRPPYPTCSMLKLHIYAKIDHIKSTRVIEEMIKFHDTYKFVCDRITPDKCSIQRYYNDLGHYYKILPQTTL